MTVGEDRAATDSAHLLTEEGFRRDGPTVLAYAALVCFTFWNYAYGPALTLLRGELEFSYTMLGVYTAAWSGGTVLTGVTFSAAARRFPRGALLWGSALLAAGGAWLFGWGSGVPLTLTGAGVLGFGGTMLLTVLQAILSDRHGSRRDRALTEANIGAAACAVLAPLALGALAAGPLGWRAAFALPVLGLAGLYLRYRRQPLPTPSTQQLTRRQGRLPLASYLFAGLVAASMAVEFCLVYFGAEQLRALGLSTTTAATAMSSHYLGLLLGRFAGAVATRRPGRTVGLLYASLVITAGGFLVFWLTALPAVAALGLLLAGLGIANLYPLALALALAAAPGREDQANSLGQLLGGLLVITAPYLLGRLADRLGLTTAFTIEPVLIGLCLLLLLAGLQARHTGGQPPLREDSRTTLAARCRPAERSACGEAPTAEFSRAEVDEDDRNMGVSRVVPDLVSSSLDSAAAFYGDVLGLLPVMDHGWIVTLADPERPQVQVSLMTHDATAPVVPDASFQVDDVDACHAAAVRAGAEIVHPLTDEPWGVRRFFVRDPDGHVINVLSHP